MRRALLLSLALASPSTASAGPWTLGAGILEVKEGIGFWTTDRKFASSLDQQLTFSDRGPVEAGERIPFDPSTGGRMTVVGFETGVQLGILDWLDLGVAVPLLAINFDTEPVDTVDGRFGLGDIRASAQVLLPVPLEVPVLAARLEVELPTGHFDPSVFAAPLTEGQLDLTTVLSAGASLPWQSWASANVGYRVRFENPDNGADPGDELLYHGEVGTHLIGGLSGKLALDGLLGRGGNIDRFGASTPLPRRRVFSGWLGLWWSFGDLAVEASGRWLFAGEDFPAGVQVFTGVRGTIRLFGDR